MASKEELELVHDKGRNKAITFAQQGLDDDKGREKAIAQEELDDDKERKRAIARNTVVGDPPLDVIRKLKKQETKREIGAQVKMGSNKGRNKAGFIPIPLWQYENPEAREDFDLYSDDDEGENVEIASSNLKGVEFVRYKCSQARIVEAPVEMMRKYKKQLMKQRKRDERMGWTPEKLRKATAEVEQEARRLLLSIKLEKLNLNLSPEKEQEQQGGPSFSALKQASPAAAGNDKNRKMASKEELELVHDKGRNKAITFAQQGLDDDKGREKAIAQEELDDDKERKRAIARTL